MGCREHFIWGWGINIVGTQNNPDNPRTKMDKHANLKTSKRRKNDEFYTQLNDIENELQHYKEHFRDKVVYCNCDDPRVSNFFYYFSHKFEHLGLKKLITTCYKNNTWDMFSQHDQEQAIRLEYTGDRDGNRKPDADEIRRVPLKGDGDFRSQECIEILKQADIVVTNPPFSLFREYVAQLMEYDKKFLIIGNQNAITYKEIFPLIKENKIWLGYVKGDMEFKVPEYYPPKKHRYRIDERGNKFYSLGNAKWFTNLEIEKRRKKLILYKEYDPEKYPKYDNYDAIEVCPVKEIPVNYGGVMGVPITFLDKHNPDQFEVLGLLAGKRDEDLWGIPLINRIPCESTGSYLGLPTIKSKSKFARILIRNKNPQL